jgi:hypothetical protein
MRRREFLAALGVGTVWPVSAVAQARPIIGFLGRVSFKTFTAHVHGFLKGSRLAALSAAATSLSNTAGLKVILIACRRWLRSWRGDLLNSLTDRVHAARNSFTDRELVGMIALKDNMIGRQTSVPKA